MISVNFLIMLTSIASYSTVLKFVSISLPQRTPLHIAVKEFQIHTVDALVVNGANINSRDNYGVIEGLQCT